ncbi:MAG: sensor histidine kinase [Xanthomonadaceae bacterium]|jgi:two-component system sensor histidine kinase RegB|nr:sensor histidine kinase [Xanthomonadaceae bacterium]
MPTVPANDISFLRTLRNLRWLAVIGQIVILLIAAGPMRLHLPMPQLCAGVGVLIVFNLYVSVHMHYLRSASLLVAFLHIAVDIAVLAWLIGWSGGLTNPFASLFLIPIALAAIALPWPGAIATALLCLAAYALSAILAHPLHVHEGDAFDLHLWGMAVNFLLSALVVLYFATHLALQLRRRERELAAMGERFVRNEGIVALATHAAAVAHELNTPLATMTLLAEDISENAETPELREDAETLNELLVLCRDRVRTLAAPESADLERIISQWQLVRPAVVLHRDGRLPSTRPLDPAIGHLLQALLNNAADASAQAGSPRVDLRLSCKNDVLDGEVRDYGKGFDPGQALLPARLFRSGKPDGLGIGLALSHATVERFGGRMTMLPANGGGVSIRFRLPLSPPAFPVSAFDQAIR